MRRTGSSAAPGLSRARPAGRRRVVVVGGGIAGLVAARALAARPGLEVQLLEAAPVLGGKAAAWHDGQGQWVDAGLHVCFPFYRHMLALLGELGTADRIAWSAPQFNYVGDGGTLSSLRFAPLPAPLHAALAIGRFAQLTPRERWHTLRCAAAALLGPVSWHARWQGLSFAGWAGRQGLPPAVLHGLFAPMVGGLTFLDVHRVSAVAMLGYIRAIGAGRQRARIGLFRGGTGAVVIAPLAADARRRGVHITTGQAVTGLVTRGAAVCGVRLGDGREIAADQVIAAVPAHVLPGLMPASWSGMPAVSALRGLQPTAVASVLLRLDRTLDLPAGLCFSAGCVFNTWADLRDLLPGEPRPPGSLLQFVVAPLAGPEAGDDAWLIRRVIDDLQRVLPASAGARVCSASVTRTPQAFHACVPGADALRPRSDIGVPGLMLAGDHVGPGRWPNMETAVASALQAAGLALAAIRP